MYLDNDNHIICFPLVIVRTTLNYISVGDVHNALQLSENAVKLNKLKDNIPVSLFYYLKMKDENAACN